MARGEDRKGRKAPPRRSSAGREKALFDLFWELAFAYLRLNAAGSKIAAPAHLSPGKISLLRSVRDGGPQSVAQLARSRPVARQGVQAMADQLVSAGLAEYSDNPVHRRAKLMGVTAKGVAALERMLSAQMKLAGSLSADFNRHELETAIDVLRRLRSLLASRS